MLTKLLKHEWERLWKVPTALLVILQIFALISGLGFLAPIWESEVVGLSLLAGLVWVIFFIAIIGVSFGIMIYLAMQFYRSMYSDEGYLTHTLPVSSGQLLFTKSLMMVIWSVLSTLGVLFSILIFAFTGILCYFGTIEWGEAMTGIRMEFNELIQSLGVWGIDWIEIVLTGLVGALISLCYGVAIIVASITIGQLARKHRVAAAFAVGCGISIGVSVFENLLRFPFVNSSVYQGNQNVILIIFGGVWRIYLLYLVITVVLFAVSNYIIRNRLNLE